MNPEEGDIKLPPPDDEYFNLIAKEEKKKFQSSCTLRLVDIEKELEDLIIIDCLCFEDEAYDEESFLNLYHKAKNTFFVITYEEVIIAYIAGYVNKQRIGVIASIAVIEEYRGKGLATMMINKLLDIFRSFKIKQTILHVKVSNHDAFGLYVKLGFKVAQLLENYYNKEDGYLMVRYEQNLPP